MKPDYIKNKLQLWGAHLKFVMEKNIPTPLFSTYSTKFFCEFLN